MIRLIVILVAFSTLCGCGAALSSNSLQKPAANGLAQGQIYYLPRAVVHAHLYASPTKGLSIVLDAPELVPDTGAGLIALLPDEPPPVCSAPRREHAGPYLLRYQVSGLHEDTISVETEDSLLKAISADTKERLTTALSNAAKSVAALGFEAAVLDDAESLFSLRFDPADCGDLELLNRRLASAVRTLGIPRLQTFKNAGAGVLPQIDLGRAAADFTISLVPYEAFRASHVGARVAGHNVRHPDHGLASEIMITPGFDGFTAQFGTFPVASAHADPRCIAAASDLSLDYAVLRLADRSIGTRLGWFGYAAYSERQLVPLLVNVSGYPVDRSPRTQYFNGGRIEDVSDQFLDYAFDTEGGMSGAPIFALFGSQRVAVGVHTHGSDRLNRARRIDDSVFDFFQRWSV